jgi:ethanolamine-phosphate cytidylyltransferase
MKWVDEVVEAAPYTTELAMVEKHNVDYVVHGDDLVLNADGEDCYAEVKRAGK